MQNLFGQAKIELPSSFRDDYNKYCQHKNPGAREKTHKYPFPRNVDMWFLSICIAVKLEIEPDFSFFPYKGGEWNAIPGSVFGSDLWMSDSLVLLAIAYTKDKSIIDKPNEMMKIANAYAIAGHASLLVKLKEGEGDSILDCISDYLVELIEE